MQKGWHGKIRIIGGLWRGRKLSVADEEELRPTTDRIRETLFNWLQTIISGANCLDLFAGTGSLSFEALSRGAASSILIEQNSSLLALLKENKKALAAENAKIENCDGIEWLRKCHQSFDIIFLDPPFHQGFIDEACQLIRQSNCLKATGLLYIESEVNQKVPTGFSIYKQKTTAQVQYGLYKLNA